MLERAKGAEPRNPDLLAALGSAYLGVSNVKLALAYLELAAALSPTPENVNALKTQLSELESSMQADIAAVSADWDSTKEPFERVLVKPKRGGVSVQLVALVWVPA